MPEKILVIEDEPSINQMIGFALQREGYVYIAAHTVLEAQAALLEQGPDLLLVDWMLPGVSGIDFVRQLKQNEATRDIPTIMLTARTEENDKVSGLDAGADDYIAKPFSPRELMARIRALFRRIQQGETEQLTVGALQMNTGSYRVTCHEQLIELGPTEYKLLQFLMARCDRVFSRAQLLDHVWGFNAYLEERTVDVHILRLRRALAVCGCDKLIQTVRGVGYRLSTTSE